MGNVGKKPEAESTGPPAPRRTRRRLSRTLSRDRSRDYRGLLRAALSHGYRVVSLEAFLLDPAAREGGPTLILRHDLDQHPASALAMADMERALGVRSSWYVRWRTADPRVVEGLLASGASVGLHYETLTRHALAAGHRPEDPIEPLLEPAREELSREAERFAALFGRQRTICAHGDTRVPWVRNLTLLEGQDPARFGIVADANLGMREHHLAAWLTDRSAAEGLWSDGQDPLTMLREGLTPIQCLTHPNNWVSGPALWRDRALAAALPSPSPGAPARIARTRSDRPPVAA